ncbi:MAG: galactosyldiacylglycerol synthase, partial [Verrucomicrobiota bacterium]|nr:galactosyldiacylglycerol synthase [Verrucomicrobiota bacterium]
GQEEGNARLLVETNSGIIATSHTAVAAAVRAAFANDAALWRDLSANIATQSRPAASLEIARFLLAL